MHHSHKQGNLETIFFSAPRELSTAFEILPTLNISLGIKHNSGLNRPLGRNCTCAPTTAVSLNRFGAPSQKLAFLTFVLLLLSINGK